jgi:chaperonin GroES
MSSGRFLARRLHHCGGNVRCAPLWQMDFHVFSSFGDFPGMAKNKESSDPGKIKLQPLGDRVVVEREESETVTSGGIVLPDTAKDKPTRGKVISIGDGRLLENGKRAPLQVKVGDRVLFTSYAGDTFKVGTRELLLLREEDILAVM